MQKVIASKKVILAVIMMISQFSYSSTFDSVMLSPTSYSNNPWVITPRWTKSAAADDYEFTVNGVPVHLGRTVVCSDTYCEFSPADFNVGTTRNSNFGMLRGVSNGSYLSPAKFVFFDTEVKVSETIAPVGEVIQSNQDFKWIAPEGANGQTNYMVKVNNGTYSKFFNGYSANCTAAGQTCTGAGIGFVVGGTYTWCIETKNGSSYGDCVQGGTYSVVNNPATPLEIFTPVQNQLIVGATYSATWKPVSGATYKFFVDDVEVSGTNLTCAASSCSINSLTHGPGTQHTLRIEAHKSGALFSSDEVNYITY